MMDNKAQGSMFLMLLIFMLLLLFVMPVVGPILGVYFGYVLEPLIGFHGNYPVLTLFFAGLIVVFLSSLLTHIFTDWRKMGESQELVKAYQKEITEARKTGNTNRINKLMKMQPVLMKRQTEASGAMFKPLLFLTIFIFPIFMWLRTFLGGLSYFSFTVPWASNVSLFSSVVLGQSWLWLYLVFSLVCGQLFRQALKWISWTTWWRGVKGRIRPSSV